MWPSRRAKQPRSRVALIRVGKSTGSVYGFYQERFNNFEFSIRSTLADTSFMGECLVTRDDCLIKKAARVRCISGCGVGVGCGYCPNSLRLVR